jgi:hypothetical protein
MPAIDGRTRIAAALLPAVVFGIVAFVGEGLTQDSPDWVRVLVAVMPGVTFGGLMRIVLGRRSRPIGARRTDSRQ